MDSLDYYHYYYFQIESAVSLKLLHVHLVSIEDTGQCGTADLPHVIENCVVSFEVALNLSLITLLAKTYLWLSVPQLNV